MIYLTYVKMFEYTIFVNVFVHLFMLKTFKD